jgi:hypothetical protein
MFLLPSEVGFLKLLKEARVPLVEFELPAKKILSKLPLLKPESSQLTRCRHPVTTGSTHHEELLP